jgi:hypoxanthine phosphoribosyltransferase
VDDPNIGEVLVGAEELQARVAELGAEINRDYAGRDLVMIGVLKGAVLFLADLMRELEIPCEVDFMAVSSYGSATDSSGVVRILKDLDREPRSLEVCALLTKPERRRVDLPIRYVGFEIPNRFAIGYGLDHGQRYRNLRFVAALQESKGRKTA